MRSIFQMGRYGDILSLIPAVYVPTKWYCAEPFVDVIAGHPYIVPHPILGESVDIPVRLCEGVRGVVTQVYKNPKPWPRERSLNFQHECWQRFFPQYDETECLDMLVKKPLDLRYLGSEQGFEFAKSNIPVTEKPPLLVNLASLSSPFPHNKAQYLYGLSNSLQNRYYIIDITSLVAPKFAMMYNVLRLVKHLGGALVTVDTGLLHMAYAVGLPTVALVNDDPWLASITRPHWRARIPYKIACNFSFIRERI